MKTKLLSKIRSRYKIVISKSSGLTYYHVLDMKEETEVFVHTGIEYILYEIFNRLKVPAKLRNNNAAKYNRNIAHRKFLQHENK